MNRKKIIEAMRPIYYAPEFDVLREHSMIIGPMPNLEAYKIRKQKVVEGRKGSEGTFLEAGFVEPILLPEQERHLFRKLGYLKHLTRCLAHESTPAIVKKHYRKVIELQNMLALANVRLAASFCKNVDGFMRDELASHLLQEIVHLVGRFDWRKNFRFNTYAFKTLIKTKQAFFKNYYNERESEAVEDKAFSFCEYESLPEEEEQYNQKFKQAICFLLGCLGPKRREVIEKRFGLNGHEETIPSKMKVIAEHGELMKRQGVDFLLKSSLTMIKESISNKAIPDDVLVIIEEHEYGDHKIPFRQ